MRHEIVQSRHPAPVNDIPCCPGDISILTFNHMLGKPPDYLSIRAPKDSRLGRLSRRPRRATSGSHLLRPFTLAQSAPIVLPLKRPYSLSRMEKTISNPKFGLYVIYSYLKRSSGGVKKRSKKKMGGGMRVGWGDF